jgi:phosphoglycerate dehydrogenase-like enzyme
MEQEIDARNDKRFGKWGLRIMDHDGELRANIENEDSSQIGRDPDFSITAAEHAIGLTIMSMRGFDTFYRDQLNKEFNHKQFRTINKKIIGIIGNGGVGGRVKDFMCTFYPLTQVYAFSKDGHDQSFTMDKFDALLPKLDIIIIAIPLTEETHHIFSAERIRNMKDGALLVNSGRADIVDQDELVKHLYQKRIYAAVDEVTPTVLPKDHAMWEAPNLIMTPHIGINVR